MHHAASTPAGPATASSLPQSDDLQRALAVARPAAWMTRRALLVLGLAAAVALVGCNSPEVDAVREYKAFLDKAKAPLAAMNKAREELYQLNDVQEMLPLFQHKLLPQVQTLSELAKAQSKPATRLGDIHDTLRETLQNYAMATDKLTERLKSKKEADREHAIVAWGEDDKRFGDQMNALADDLARYLDEVKK